MSARPRTTAAFREVDPRTVRAVAWIRALVAASAAIACAFLPESFPHRSALQFGTGLLWVPWAALLCLVADGPRIAILRTVGAAGDLFVAFALSIIAPDLVALSFALYALAVVAAAYMANRRSRFGVAIVAVALAFAGAVLRPSGPQVGLDAMVAFAVVVFAVVIAFERAAGVQALAAARSVVLEGKSAAIIDHVGDGVVVTDAAGLVRQWNHSAALMTACGPLQAIGETCQAMLGLHDGDNPLDCSSGCPLLRTTGADTFAGREVWRWHADGRRQPIIASASAVTNDHGETVEVVHSLRDITRQKQADEAKAMFLATASHELKTPLTVIGGFAETLLSGRLTDPDQQRAALETIARRSFDMARLVDRLLLSSRIESGRVEVSLAETDVVEAVRERVASYTGSTGRRISFEAAEAIPHGLADPVALVTIADHLLDNAIKYSPDDEKIDVRVSICEDRVVVEVTDRGIGMDAEAVLHCFDPFWQAESTDVRRFGGTGIGLYIVRSLAEAMGATMSVTSEPGRGSTFVLKLRAFGREAPVAGAERSSVREFMRLIGVPRERA